jgi:hypothetical protein
VGNIWKYETHNDDLHDLHLSSILLGWLNREKIFRECSKHGFTRKFYFKKVSPKRLTEKNTRKTYVYMAKH